MLDCAPVNPLAPIRVRSSEERATEISWSKALLAIGVVSTMLFGGLGALGLVGPDEPRYAAIAREMAQTGDWVTPRLYGRPWLEKPVLYYWAAASAFRLFGVSEFAARLPGALGALLATLATAWAALRIFGIEAAWLTLLILPTTIGMFTFARGASPDMIFSASLALTAVAAAELLAKPRPGLLARLAFGVFLGAAALAKGPAAVILAAGAIFLWALGSRQWRAALRFLHPTSIAAFCAVAVPWYVLVRLRNPEFFRVFFLEHNFQRYLTPVFQHPQPVWFLGVVLAALVFPWTALLVPLAVDSVRAIAGRTQRDSPFLFFACWAVFPVLFFSFSRSKLPGYVLPAVAPLVLLAAASTARRLGTEAKTARMWIAAVGCTFMVLSLAAGTWLRRSGDVPGIAEWGAAKNLLALALVGGAVCAILALARGVRAGTATAAVLVVVLGMGANAVLLPKLDPFLSARAVVRATPEEIRKAPNLFAFHVDRSWKHGLDFYLRRELMPWEPSTASPCWVWTDAETAAELFEQSPRWSVVTRAASGPWLLRLE